MSATMTKKPKNKLETYAEAQARKGVVKVQAPEAVPQESAPVRKKPERQKKVRIAYPGLNVDPSGKTTTRLTEWPADHDPKVHLPLMRRDFENEAPWLVRKAERLEAYAAELRKQAEEARVLGNRAERAKVAKLRKMADSMNALKAQLAEQGLDLDTILGQKS